MRLGRPLPPIDLAPEERTTLEQWARRRTTVQALALRPRLILRCATDEPATAIARDVHVTKQTVEEVTRLLRHPPARRFV
jgi:hypothetical protein